MPSQSPVIVVVGPTSAGKSALAVAVSEWFGGEVVSADAFQVYRGLDIGTGKIDASLAGAIPHHCIDVADPNEHYSAGQYARDASAVIAQVQSRGNMAVIAGGSGFYIRALINGLTPLPDQDERWRKALEAVETSRGFRYLFAMLQALDPEWAEAIGGADRQRTFRGLEVTLRLGVPMSVLLKQQGWSGPHFDAIWVGLTSPRKQIYKRIEVRIDKMLSDGWLDEVRRLLSSGCTPESPGMRAIGYRDLVAHLAGEISLGEAREAVVVATRRYAKRQLTWFRRQSPAIFFEIDQADDANRERVYDEIRADLGDRLTCYRYQHEPG
ncbi:MAG: tRNA (adenosine(37)-N6)-dimethylallyltransferase MiaA [Acidobacteria bacterium]|nr:tRNA (adenosine(37)-N6)-dimethylallyltransferase MiaA [Acidobacteriota bacterium]